MQKELTLEEFYASDPQRAGSPEVPYGSLWREFAPFPTHRLAWVQTTGELYAVELSEPDERKDPVEVLGVLWSRPHVEACLAGWPERCSLADLGFRCPPVTVVVRVAQVACGPSAARLGFRSRLVADASGAPVLRDQGPDRPAGHGKADPRLEHRELGKHSRPARPRGMLQLSGLACRPWLTVSDRREPLLGARRGHGR